MTKALSIFCTIFFLISCHDGCDKGDTRCNGQTVEECWSDEDWSFVEDCSTVGPGSWECCENAFIYEDAETAGCVPVDECGIDTGE